MTDLTGTHARGDRARLNESRHEWNRTTTTRRPRDVDRETGLTVAELTGHQRDLKAAMYARLGQQSTPSEGTR